MAKILIADDDTSLVEMLQDYFKSRTQHLVETAFDGVKALELMLHFQYDAIVLDWQMPGMTGVEVLSAYRDKAGSAAIIMLTKQADIKDKGTGFQTGADDYLTKPFDPEELILRVDALLRRSGTKFRPILEAGGVQLDPQSRTVRYEGRDSELGQKEFALLEFLMRHPGQVFAVNSLMDRVWPSDSEASPQTVKVCINRIRSKLGLPKEHLIKNIFGQGYKLEE